MELIATLLERRPAVQAFRRALNARTHRIIACRTPAHLSQLLAKCLIDVIALGPTPARSQVLEALRRDYPTVPLLLYAPLRSDDAELLVRLQRERVVTLAIEGIDEPVLARRLSEHGTTARRVAALGHLGAQLDLVDDLQKRTWDRIVRDAPAELTTASLAKGLGVTRETLSRRFSAGGAPRLKHAIDAIRLFAAGQLLRNPAYKVEDVARLLGFSSASLLQRTSRRSYGVAARGIGALTDEEWVRGLRGARGDWE